MTTSNQFCANISPSQNSIKTEKLCIVETIHQHLVETSTMSDYLPDDVIQSILLRLPAKPLIRFKAVSRSWQKLISSPDFMKARTSLMNIENPRFQIIHTLCNGGIYLVRSAKHPYTEVLRLQPPFWPNDENLRTLGSYNGVVCMKTQIYAHPRIYFWNPTIMDYETIFDFMQSEPRIKSFVYGFGYATTSSNAYAYKLVKIMYFHKVAPEIRVYSVLENSWRNLGSVSLPYYLHDGVTVCVNGYIHWTIEPTRRCDEFPSFIATFDMYTDVLGEIKLPKCIPPKFKTLSLSNGQLSLIVESSQQVFEVWVMNNYGIPDSWTKNYVVRARQKKRSMIFSPVGLIGEGMIFKRHRDHHADRLYLYDPKSEYFEDLGVETYGWIDGCHVTVYSESFLPLRLSNSSSHEIQEEGMIQACRRFLNQVGFWEILALILCFLWWGILGN